MTRRRVVVTGLGCISPVGNTVAESWANLLAGKPGIDQPRPVRHIAGCDAPLVQVIPALAAEPVAQLCKPHRVVGVERRLRGFAPMLREQLQHDEQPGEAKQQRETRLARRCGHDTPVSAISLAFRLMNGSKLPSFLHPDKVEINEILPTVASVSAFGH